MSDRAKQILADPQKAAALLRHATGEKPVFRDLLLAAMEENKVYDLQEIATRCEVAVSTVFRWLKGGTVPYPKVQEKLLEMVGNDEG